MANQEYGALTPTEGGDPIPLIAETMTIGRRESCDICLRHNNVSSRHGEMVFQDGYWQVRDLNSSNGVKINGGSRITPMEWKPLQPGDEVSFASHQFTLNYTCENPQALQAAMAQEEDIFSKSLMEKAGLQKAPRGK